MSGNATRPEANGQPISGSILSRLLLYVDVCVCVLAVTFDGELGAPANPGTHKTEFRAPLPPHELNFHRDGAAEIACFARILQRMGPTAAASLSPSYFSATLLHVHVNVRSAAAAGTLLSAREILAAWLEWVVFDMVTLRLARPWVWR